MNALSIILNIVLILVSLVLIAVVLMQQGQRQGLGAISGGAETFFGKGKAKGLDAKLQKITKIAAVVFIILAIATTMVVAHINNAAQEAALEALTEEDLAAIEAGEAHLHDDGSIHYYEDDTAATEEEAAVTEEAADTAEETPAEEPAEETPAEETPVEEPAEETPAEEAPVEETVDAAEETTEEAPAEEAAQAE